jgi:Dna[CI] antecedent, DciA
LYAMRDLLKGTLGRSLRALREEDRLAAAWLVACGRVLAEHGTVVGYADGIVRIEVGGIAWLEQLKSMETGLETELARIADVPITGIHFVVKT